MNKYAPLVATAAAAQPGGYPVNGIDVSSHDHTPPKTIGWTDLGADIA